MKRISIVIPTRNRASTVLALAEILRPGLEEGHELLLVDDSEGSMLREQVSARFPNLVRVNSFPIRRGVIPSVNQGIMSAQNDYVLLFSDDHYPLGDSRAFLAALSGFLDNHPLVGIDTIDQKTRPFHHKGLARLAWVVSGQIFPSCSSDFKAVFAFDKTRIRQLLDVEFNRGNGFNAESDFQLSARERGYHLFVAPGLLMRHKELRLSKNKGEMKEVMSANHRLFLRKHFRSWRAKMVFYRIYLVLWAAFVSVG